VTVVDGIKAAVPNANVTYAQGCDVKCETDAGFGEAAAAASAAQPPSSSSASPRT
jgi:hypothetical protein